MSEKWANKADATERIPETGEIEAASGGEESVASFPDALAVGKGPEDLLSLCAPQFKTFITPDGRKGVRLESTFWRALAAIGRTNGGSRGALVSRVLLDARTLGINATSALRSIAVNHLMNEVERLQSAAAAQDTVRLLQLAPAPVFSADRRLRLVQANSEFRRYLRLVLGGVDAGPSDKVQLSFDTPASTLVNELDKGEAIEIGMLITVGVRERRSIVRLVSIPPPPGRVIVGYVLQ